MHAGFRIFPWFLENVHQFRARSVKPSISCSNTLRAFSFSGLQLSLQVFADQALVWSPTPSRASYNSAAPQVLGVPPALCLRWKQPPGPVSKGLIGHWPLFAWLEEGPGHTPWPSSRRCANACSAMRSNNGGPTRPARWQLTQARLRAPCELIQSPLIK